MKFFEFIENMSSNGFIYYQDNTFSSVHEDEFFEDCSSNNVSDLIPFVVDIPLHIKTARFSQKHGSYLVYMVGDEIKSILSYNGESINDFLKRAV